MIAPLFQQFRESIRKLLMYNDLQLFFFWNRVDDRHILVSTLVARWDADDGLVIEMLPTAFATKQDAYRQKQQREYEK